MNIMLNNTIKYWKSICICIKLSWNSSKLFTIIRFLGRIVSPILPIVSAYALKVIIDLLIYDNTDKHKLIIWCGITSCIYILQMILQKIVGFAENTHNELIRKQINTNMMSKILNADIEMFDNRVYYDKFFSVSRDQSVLTLALWNVLDVLSMFISLFGILFITYRSKKVYIITIILTAIPSAIVGQYYTKKLYDLNLKQVNSERKEDYIFSLASDKNVCQEIRLLNISEWLKNRFDSNWIKNFNSKQLLLKNRLFITIVVDILPDIAIFFIMINLISQIVCKDNSIGDYTFYFNLIVHIKLLVCNIINDLFIILSNQLKIDNILDFEKIENKIIDQGSEILNEIRSVEFNNISFKYPGTSTYVINKLNLKIKSMDKLCIVGVNGSGKSTLIKLLMRFYDVTDGQILINQKDIKKYSIKSLRKCFSCYFQNSHNYAFSIIDNIKIGDIDKYCDDFDCKKALKTVKGHDILTKCNNDVNMFISRAFDDKGIEFSGGQHQKLALARTVYRNASFLIFDEPSSNLDPKAEDAFFKLLNNTSKNKTVIFTSHRLSNIGLADKIVMMEKGRIVAVGTKEDLLDKSKSFSEMYNIQAQKFK